MPLSLGTVILSRLFNIASGDQIHNKILLCSTRAKEHRGICNKIDNGSKCNSAFIVPVTSGTCNLVVNRHSEPHGQLLQVYIYHPAEGAMSECKRVEPSESSLHFQVVDSFAAESESHSHHFQMVDNCAAEGAMGEDLVYG